METLTEKRLGKRTGIDFSKHEVIITETEGLSINYLKKPNTITDSIKFINTHGICAVTGDYGNWIFCREFHPNPKEGVSDGYWKEKLHIASTQVSTEYDAETTEKRILEKINGGAEEYGYIGDKLEKAIEYYQKCLQYVEDELDYTSFAFRQHPYFMDAEDVIYCKDTKVWLKAVFDGFDEMCYRMKNNTLTPSLSTGI